MKNRNDNKVVESKINPYASSIDVVVELLTCALLFQPLKTIHCVVGLSLFEDCAWANI